MSVEYEPDNLSSGAAAVYFLFWQEPTDRALAGWSPYSTVFTESLTSLEKWLGHQLTVTNDEVNSRVRYQRGEEGHNDVSRTRHSITELG